MEDLPDIAIIGPGKVGTSIALLAKRSGYRIVAIAGRDHNKADQAAEVVGGEVRVCTPAEAARAAKFVLLTVSDSAIESVCRHVADCQGFSPGQIVAHCSGALGSEILAAAKAHGATIGAAHPLQTFATVQSAIDGMPGSYWFCEGEEAALKVLEELVKKIGGVANTISSTNKDLYHCASTIACNYLTTLIDVALHVAERAGLDRGLAWQSLRPLVQGTITNIDQLGTTEALTGPIARGDVQTVMQHLKVLANEDAEISELYRVLGKLTIELAMKKGSLPASTRASLLNVLAESSCQSAGK